MTFFASESRLFSRNGTAVEWDKLANTLRKLRRLHVAHQSTAVLMTRTTTHFMPVLPPPTRLHVDYVPSLTVPSEIGIPPAVIDSVSPRFFFVPENDKQPPQRHAQMSAYRIVIQQANRYTNPVWDSGRVAAISAVGIRCGVTLQPRTSYNWTAIYWHKGVALPSLPASGTFDVGLLSDADWEGAPWLDGSIQREFRLRFLLRARNGSRASLSRARLYLCSPSGAVLHVNGVAIGDRVGLSAWTSFDKRLTHTTFDVASHILLPRPGLQPWRENTISIAIGSGWPSRDGSVTMKPALRVLLVVEDSMGHAMLVHSATPKVTVEGRRGRTLEDSPLTGCRIDCTLSDSDGWSAVRMLPGSRVPTARILPLTAPAATMWGELRATHVIQLGERMWHYAFSVNLVGIVAVLTSTLAGEGEITIEHCERLVVTNDSCVPLWENGPVPTDIYYVATSHGPLAHGQVDSSPKAIDSHNDGGRAMPLRLWPRFTWHGFQHVLVRTRGNVTFTGAPDAITAAWTTSQLERSGEVRLMAGAGAELLSSLQRMAYASQLSNMAAFVPTDCPTREKHAWLGDALNSAEHAMVAVWAPRVFHLFLEMIRDQQIGPPHSGNGSLPPFAGFVPVVVPSAPAIDDANATTPPAWAPGDLSWSAAYPMIVRWMLLYYDDLALAESHWEHLVSWADGVDRAARATTHSLPNFWQFGDWCALEPRQTCTPGTGPLLAAANYLLALEALIDIAHALIDTTGTRHSEHLARNVTKFRQRQAAGQVEFVKQYWNASLGGFVADRPSIEHQTLASVAHRALSTADETSVPKQLRIANARLLANVVRNWSHHVTVGSTGATWLLHTLSDSGVHDDALQMALQTNFPRHGTSSQTRALHIARPR